jgi:hypothetical protein
MTIDLLAREGIEGCRAFLLERDGDADLLNRAGSAVDPEHPPPVFAVGAPGEVLTDGGRV